MITMPASESRISCLWALFGGAMDSSNIKLWTARAAAGCKTVGRISLQGYRRAKPVVISACRSAGRHTVRFYRYSKPIVIHEWHRLEQTPFFQKHKKQIYGGAAG